MVDLLLVASFGSGLMGLVLGVVALFLILLILVQRGRGGGLAGALGGMGGSSAFGAKAGDVFTKITIGAASVWIVLCIAAARIGAPSGESRIATQGTSSGARLIPGPGADEGQADEGTSATASAGATAEGAASAPAGDASAPAGDASATGGQPNQAP